MITILEAATQVGLTKQKVRYWVDLLNITITKKNRKFYLPDNSINLLLAMKQNISSGLSPSLASKEVKELHTIKTNPLQAISKENLLNDRIDMLEQAVMLLVKENQAQRELLNKRFNRIELKLDPPTSHKQIEVWKPSEPKRPKYSTLQRIWYEVTNPEKLRAN